MHRILAENIGIACMTLGGGRETKDSVIDLSVGIYLKKKNGDAVDTGNTLAVIYANDREKMDAAAEKYCMLMKLLPCRKKCCRS